MEKKKWSKGIKALLWVAAIFLLLVIGYFILNAVINKKAEQALQQISPELKITYSSIHPGIFSSSLIINDLTVTYIPMDSLQQHQHYFSCERVVFSQINFLKLISSKKLIIHAVRLETDSIRLDHFLLDKKITPHISPPDFENLSIDEVELTDIHGSVHTGERKDISFNGNLLLESIKIDDLKKSMDENNFHFGSFSCHFADLRYIIPNAFESLHIKNLSIDSKQSSLHIDSCRIIPTMDKFDIGKKKGHQVDYIEGFSAGISIEKLDVMQLFQQKLIAEKIIINQNRIYAFRDRRLPLQADTKALPVEDLKDIPINIRVGSLAINATTFTYEEFPKDGKETGTLKILRLHGSISPLINRPTKTDPEFMRMKMEGSLMGSGTVEASMKLPLRKDSNYFVQGAFHNLDVTTLNSPAENLGKLHIESGMLNSLAFDFMMTEEKSTGKIIGEYHNLVIDKLREKSDEKKIDKFKSFFLKKLIIRKNKDKSLAESKRTGKVDYKRDPSRYFSFYLLHSLLMGVKSSFSLGFLLPG